MTVNEKIISVVSSHDISSQAELEHRLIQRGVRLTQSTLSRRLQKLMIAKEGGIYRILGAGSDKLPQVDIVLSPPNLLIIKTMPGFAAAIAYALDKGVVKDSIAGTVAGEDTVMVALKEGCSLKKVAKEIVIALKIKN